MKPIDPILLAILNGRLVQIALAMAFTTRKTAPPWQSTTGLPIFVGARAFAV